MIEDMDSETIEVGDLDPAQWNEYANDRGWSDGFPLAVPTQEAVDRFLQTCRKDNAPFAPMSPRLLVPTMPAIAANAVMAGCRAEYFPVVVAAVRAVLDPAYNLHGTLATTHPCAQLLIVSGPLRGQLDINCTGNCFGQGRRANATIGRALQLTLLNIGGARPGEMDRATQGSPAKYAFCFGENEEESPWEPYHVRRGFDAGDSVVTAFASEPPHNINDHASTSGEGILQTIAGTISQTGANVLGGHGPYVVVIGPEHAHTIHRDGWTIPDIQEKLFEDSAVHISRVPPEKRKNYAVDRSAKVVNDKFYLTCSPEGIHILVAGGPGKHSAYIPTFGSTEACSVRISNV
ncbi:MAG: hypothetical protein CFH40_01131 [Alphaproteobacteria bacterium MarineAlpha10_Bin3]|jgi:hypothetical protein|nr:MAG: hypothetical protein CFH40_01131 [Alphaproteobacteria bacterium MarineAlpha10_Bin3]PPR71648.1 MAG: hypothetical protein CFH09_01131 [Alphaproteobacteria bacterium MarineAlpha4_Bin1]